MKPLHRMIGSLLLAGLCLISGPGCLGRFAMTTSVRKFNLKAFDSQWGREILFLGLHVVPVYPFCAFADIMVVNSIEFWTETNPIDGEKAITLSQGESPRDEERNAVASRPQKEEVTP